MVYSPSSTKHFYFKKFEDIFNNLDKCILKMEEQMDFIQGDCRPKVYFIIIFF